MGDGEWPGLPGRQLVRRTVWFDEYRSPLLPCKLVVGEVSAVRVSAHEPTTAFEVDYDAERRVVRLGDVDPVEIEVDALNLTLEVSDEVVGYSRKREGRFLQWDSRGPWE